MIAAHRPMLLLAGSLLMLNCDQPAPPEPVRRVLVGSVLSDTGLADPMDLLALGSCLVVLDPLGDAPVALMDTSSGTVLARFGGEGEGPGEFKAAWSLARDASEATTVWLYDFGLRRMNRLHTDCRSIAYTGSFVLQTPATTYSPVWLDDSTVAAPGFFGEGRLALVRREGKTVNFEGSIPSAGRPGVPATVRQHAHQASVAVHPEGQQLALANRHAGRLELYDREFRVSLAQVPDTFDAEYHVARGRRGPILAMEPDARFGYVDVAATRDRIYALFSGRSRGGDVPPTVGDRVHVFDWEGRLLGELQLDTFVSNISLTDDGSRMYAVQNYPVVEIRRYSPRLPDASR